MKSAKALKTSKNSQNIKLSYFWKLIFSKTKPGDNLLDLGCGNGQNLIYLSRKGANITAVDKSLECIKELREKIEKEKIINFDVICSDITKFNIPENKFDIIIANNVLQFIDRKKSLQLILNIKDCLKNNGIIGISSFTIDDPCYKPAKTNLTYFSHKELLNLFKDFKILFYIESIIADKPHQGMPYNHRHGIVRLLGQKNP